MIAIPSGYEQKQQLAHALLTRQQRRSNGRVRHRRLKGEPMDLLTWATLYRRELRPGLRFSLNDHRYLAAMYQVDASEVVYMKAGQIGVSELLITYVLHMCDQRAGDALYLMPTQTDVSDFSQSRFGPALEASEYLAGVVVGAGKAIRGVDKISLKRIRRNFLYMRGGTVDKDGRARQLKSVPADCLVVDEVDEVNPAAIPIAEKRLGHSPIKEIRRASTPTYHGVGIHADWERSDQREWFVPCPHCGKRQTMDFWTQVVIERDALKRPSRWHGQGDGRAYVACIKCGKELDRLAPGEWVPRYPDRDVVGFHPTKLMAGHTSLLEIVIAFQNIEENAVREATNQHLGLAHEPEGGRLRSEDLDACRRDYLHGTRPGTLPVMGVDVGDPLLHVIVRDRTNQVGEQDQLWAGTVNSFEDVGRLITKYNVETCCIDMRPEVKLARAFQSEYTDGKVWLVDYLDTDGSDRKRAPVEWDARNGVAKASRTRTLDTTYGRFYSQSNSLPANARDIPDYYQHLTNLVRQIEEKSDGTRIARYVKTGNDHFAHAENYATIASQRPVGWAI